MKTNKIAVLGGDGRQSYLIAALSEMGYKVSAYGVNDDGIPNCATLSDALEGASAAVLPFPVTPDGVFLNASCETCNVRLTSLFEELSRNGVSEVLGGGVKDGVHRLAGEFGISVFDYGKNEDVLIKNALCTAEGAIEIAMRELPIYLCGSKAVVIGYGRIGSLLAKRLRALGACVTVAARKSEARALAASDGMDTVRIPDIASALPYADVIFNTVPALILDKRLIALIPKSCLTVDLASAPGGVDFKEAEKAGLKVIWALSLPGKSSPKSAALIIANAANDYLLECGEASTGG